MKKPLTLDEFEDYLSKPLTLRRKTKYMLTRWKRKPRELKTKVKHFIQRGKRGYSDRDVWGLDYYLAKVISESTEQLADTLHGYPADMTPETWEAHLREISARFQVYVKDSDNYDIGSDDFKKNTEKMFALLGSRFPSMWD